MNRSPVHTQSALDSLETWIGSAKHDDPEIVDLVLERCGDATRSGLSLPSTIRKWLCTLGTEALDAALARDHDRLSNAPTPDGPDDLEMLEVFVCQRDRSASVLTAARFASILTGLSLRDLPTADMTRLLHDNVDGLLGGNFSRRVIESVLGQRRALVGDNDWTAALREDFEPVSDVPVLTLSGEAHLSFASPSDETVYVYVKDGRHAALIEPVAGKSPAFAEEMAAVISTLREAGEKVSLCARRWYHNHKSTPLAEGAPAPLVRMGMKKKLAAATLGKVTPADTLELGMLAPLDAFAKLEVGDEITLTVYEGDVGVTSVWLDDDHVSAVRKDGAWTIRAPLNAECRFTMVVTDTQGRRFEAHLALFENEVDA